MSYSFVSGLRASSRGQELLGLQSMSHVTGLSCKVRNFPVLLFLLQGASPSPLGRKEGTLEGSAPLPVGCLRRRAVEGAVLQPSSPAAGLPTAPHAGCVCTHRIARGCGKRFRWVSSSSN